MQDDETPTTRQQIQAIAAANLGKTDEGKAMLAVAAKFEHELAKHQARKRDTAFGDLEPLPQAIADRLQELVPHVPAESVASVALEAADRYTQRVYVDPEDEKEVHLAATVIIEAYEEKARLAHDATRPAITEDLKRPTVKGRRRQKREDRPRRAERKRKKR